MKLDKSFCFMFLSVFLTLKVKTKGCALSRSIDHFTVVCSITWPLNESESGVDLALIETSLFFLC